MRFIIRILRQVQILESVKDKEVEAVNLEAAIRQAQIILAQEFAMETDVFAETNEKKENADVPNIIRDIDRSKIHGEVEF